MGWTEREGKGWVAAIKRGPSGPPHRISLKYQPKSKNQNINLY
jgi:hypothetical protein